MRGVALVTGGAKRIGRAIMERLAQENYAVAIHGHNPTEEAHGLRAQVEASGGRAAVVRADLANEAQVRGMLDGAGAAFGPVTLLVNNASAFEPDDLETLEGERWDRHFTDNLGTPVFLARDFARQLPAERQGCIVNVIDQRVWKLTPQYFSYTLTKGRPVHRHPDHGPGPGTLHPGQRGRPWAHPRQSHGRTRRTSPGRAPRCRWGRGAGRTTSPRR